MAFKTIFFDLDDTVYPRSSGLWPAIAGRIDLFIHTRLNVPWDEIPNLRNSLFSQYGTTLRGLVALYQIDTEDYLQFVHDVPVSNYIRPDPEVRKALHRLHYKKIIFTNADIHHAQRVLRVLNIEDCFDQIIDIRTISPYCKPLPEAYKIALDKAGESSGEQCVFIDDSIKNLIAAKPFGMYTVLMSNQHNRDHTGYDAAVTQLTEIASVLQKCNEMGEG